MTLPVIAPPSTPIHHQCSPRTYSIDADGYGSTYHTSSPCSKIISATTPRTPRSTVTQAEGVRTPFTPFSERSFASSFTSPLAQFETISDSGPKKPPRSSSVSALQHRLPFRASSRNHDIVSKTTSPSLADQIDNWRTRARLNGIKVASGGQTYDNASDISEEKRPQFVTVRPTLPPCFSTPPPKRNRENVYARGAYTAPMRFPGRSPESPVLQSFYSDTSSPFASDRKLLSPIDELEDSAPFRTAPKASLAFLSAATVPAPVSQSAPASAVFVPSDANFKSNCTVCDKHPSKSFRMIVVSPCSHVFCSTCFTGTLNIVGEKNMSCMECKTPIKSFHFALDLDIKSHSTHVDDNSVPLTRSFHFLDELNFKLANTTDGFQNLSREPAKSFSNQQVTGPVERGLHTDASVLRIDNIPWDVTPSMLRKFFKLPLHSVHILLDLKGKTLSHAFVRLATPDARLALRSTQNAILGEGRRARAVTVTLASVDELLTATYPDWKGTFKNGVPSLDGLASEKVKDALGHGLLSKNQLNALRQLMLNPSSPFLKDAQLPFISLVNILLTFPTDADSKMFWNLEIRDMLYDVAMSGVKILAEGTSIASDLLNELGEAVMECQIFTELQKLTMFQTVRDSIRSNSPW